MKNNKHFPFISIVMSTRGTSCAIFEKTIFSIISSDLENCEIIIIDQNINDEIKKFIFDIDKQKLLVKKNIIIYIKSNETGLSRGRNLGQKKATGKWILFFDDDIIIPKHFSEKFIPILEKTKEIAFYGNVLNIENKTLYIKRTIKTKHIHLFNFDSVCSIGLILNRKIFENVDGFDINFGVGSKFGAGEESDIVIRILQKGFKINYLKDFIVFHQASKIDLKKKFSYGYGIGALYRKHIFNSFYYFFILGIKFIGEIILRILLSIIFIFINPLKTKNHFNYLKGYIKGFLSYKNDNSSIW